MKGPDFRGQLRDKGPDLKGPDLRGSCGMKGPEVRERQRDESRESRG